VIEEALYSGEVEEDFDSLNAAAFCIKSGILLRRYAKLFFNILELLRKAYDRRLTVRNS
jgi:hypothetical protein